MREAELDLLMPDAYLLDPCIALLGALIRHTI